MSKWEIAISLIQQTGVSLIDINTLWKLGLMLGNVLVSCLV